MEKRTRRTGEQRPGPRDRKIGNNMRWRKIYREKGRCHIQKGLEKKWKKIRTGK